MATIQVADKPTLTEVLNTVNSIKKSGGRHTQGVYKHFYREIPNTGTSISDATWFTILDISCTAESEFFSFGINSNYAVTNTKTETRCTIDGEVISVSDRNLFDFNYIKFLRNLKYEVRIHHATVTDRALAKYEINGILYL